VGDQSELVESHGVIVGRAGPVEDRGDYSCDERGESRCRRMIDVASRCCDAPGTAVVPRGSMEILYPAFRNQVCD
jgi:hypothetical protein